MSLHQDEVAVAAPMVTRLVAERFPEWADLPVEAVGAGTDNQLFRLGDDLLVRVPRTPSVAPSLVKEITWLPRLAPHLPLQVPRPVQLVEESPEFELPWAVYRWIHGEMPTETTVDDWSTYGRDLATFVRSLHATDLMGARRDHGLDGYRGGVVQDLADEVGPAMFTDLATKAGDRLDVQRLQSIWCDALTLPQPDGDQVWMHGDLKPTNMLVEDGRLVAVLDFGALTIGHPDAEHATVWDLPEAARTAYRSALEIDDEEWARARGWAIGIGVNAATYYWHSFPQMRDESLARLSAILADDGR